MDQQGGGASVMGTNDVGSANWNSINIKKLVFDGGKNEYGNDDTNAFHWGIEGGSHQTGYDILMEDCIFQNAAASAGLMEDLAEGTSEITLRRVTARNNGDHGINPTGTGEGGIGENAEMKYIDVKAIQNGGIGIDFHSGNHYVNGFYGEGNETGMKAGAAGGPVQHITLKNFHHRSSPTNKGFYQTFNQNGWDISLENVLMAGHRSDGLELRNSADATLKGTLMVTNCANEDGANNIEVLEGSTLDATDATIISQKATNGVGINTWGESSVDFGENGKYYHSNNDEGPIDGNVDVRSENMINEEKSEIDVPGPDDVGAFTSGWVTDGQESTGDSGGDSSSDSSGQLVEPELEKLDSDGKSAVFDNVATGQVDSEADRYRIKGRITEFTAEGDLTIKVDGEEISNQEFIRRFIKCEPVRRTRNSSGISGSAAVGEFPELTNPFEREGRVYAEPGEVQEVIDRNAASGDNYDMTMVCLSPKAAENNGGHYPDDELPLKIRRGVHLNLNGVMIRNEANKTFFEPEPGSTISTGFVNFQWVNYDKPVIKIDDSDWDRDATEEDPIRIETIRGRGQTYNSRGQFIHVNLQNGHSIDGGLIVSDCAILHAGRRNELVQVGHPDSSYKNNYHIESFHHSANIMQEWHSQVQGAEIRNNTIHGIWHPAKVGGTDSVWHSWLHGHSITNNYFKLLPLWDPHKFDKDGSRPFAPQGEKSAGLFWFQQAQGGQVKGNTVHNTNNIAVRGTNWIQEDHSQSFRQDPPLQPGDNVMTNYLRESGTEYPEG